MGGPFIVFDTEATDLEPGQICQLAFLIENNGTVAGLNYFFSVDDMSAGAQEVHGFSREMLSELSCDTWFEDKADEILTAFNSAKLLIGHNVAADERYLRVEMERADLKLKRIQTFCTMNYASGIMNMQRKVVTGRPKPPKLQELAEFYNVSPQEVEEKTLQWFHSVGTTLHDARYDTAMTYLCFKRAIEKGDLRGL